MAESGLKKRVLTGVVWALLERFATRVISLVVTMILAHLLTPSDYGTVALLGVFMLFANIIVDSGFGQALIQRKEVSDLDFNTVFYCSLFLSLVVYIAIFCLAPFIAGFYETKELCSILRIASVVVVFNAISSVQNADLNRRLLFNLSFKISVISCIASGITGVTLAFCGFGPWALVWQIITAAFVGMLVRWYLIAWRPRFMFSFDALKEMFGYGSKLFFSAILDVSFTNLYGLIIGRIYTKADLAFVNRGQHLPQLAMDSINGTLGRVAFPALSKLQDDKLKLREAMRKMIRVSTFVVFPLMVAMAINAKTIILILFGTQWLPSIPYLQLACFTFVLWPFHTINLQAISALGRSDVYLKLEFIKKGIGIALLILFITRGVFMFMAVSAFVGGVLSVIINAWPNKKLLDYSIVMQIKDVYPTIIISCVMGAFGLLLETIPFEDEIVQLIIRLLIQLGVGFSVYALLSFVFKITPVREFWNLNGGVLSIKFPKLGRWLNQ